MTWSDFTGPPGSPLERSAALETEESVDNRWWGTELRYVARLERNGSARVGLEALDPHHVFANLRPCDNIFAIETDCYRLAPLIIQGPGAGREVTAAAVQADLWQVCLAL